LARAVRSSSISGNGGSGSFGQERQSRQSFFVEDTRTLVLFGEFVPLIEDGVAVVLEHAFEQEQ
jgi:hypothetical protein